MKIYADRIEINYETLWQWNKAADDAKALNGSASEGRTNATSAITPASPGWCG